MQLIAFLLVPVAAVAGFLLAAALASGAREDAFRAGYRAGLQAASLALTKIAGGLSVAEDGQQEERIPCGVAPRLPVALPTSVNHSHRNAVRRSRRTGRPYDLARPLRDDRRLVAHDCSGSSNLTCISQVKPLDSDSAFQPT